ncbi:M50 family metallopeptidase [soil metagenome]
MSQRQMETERAGADEAARPVHDNEWWRLAAVVAATVALGLWAGISVLGIVLALVVMIFLHELGHYVTAKAAGMKVTEFFIGFGPRLWSFRRGETEYGLKAIPAGAYVKVIGMSNLEEVDPADEHRTYRQQPYWRRLSVAVAGSAMHFIMALFLIYTVAVGFGIPRWDVGEVTAESPARAAGLQPGDVLVSADGRTFEEFPDFSSYLRDRPGEDVDLVVERDGATERLSVTLAERNPDGEAVGFLGIQADFDRVKEGLITGVGESFSLTGETMWNSAKGLVSFFSPSGLSGYIDTLSSSTDTSPSDPGTAVAPERDAQPDDERVISIFGAVRLAADLLFADVLAFLFAINVFVGIFNLVPLLPLDGGHVAIATYERIRSRKGRAYHADVSKLLPLTYAVVVVLVLVGVTSLYLDIADPISLQ